MDKIDLVVCPHDTARNPERWFLFAQHLGKLCDKIISFKSSIDFKEFHEKVLSAKGKYLVLEDKDGIKVIIDREEAKELKELQAMKAYPTT